MGHDHQEVPTSVYEERRQLTWLSSLFHEALDLLKPRLVATPDVAEILSDFLSQFSVIAIKNGESTLPKSLPVRRPKAIAENHGPAAVAGF
jgi:hypothetical protein